MKIGIFSKLGASGGSEHRCAEMCNGIVRHTAHHAHLLCQDDLNPIVESKIDGSVSIHKNVFKADGTNLAVLYEMDSLLVVNSDSYSFAKLDYWSGKSRHHACQVELGRIKQIVFLFNFVISPAATLWQIEQETPDIRIICANRQFFYNIQHDVKFDRIRRLPRITLDSPIDPVGITLKKTESPVIRIGKHSKAHGYKFNEGHVELISRLNSKFKDRIRWDFLGVPKERVDEISKCDNVIVRNEHSIPVGEYLQGIDIFLFFISWDRNEPWSRALAEGMMSGCPILATNKAGNLDQVIHENNGFLCDSLDDFDRWLSYLIENPRARSLLGRNSWLYAQQFTPPKVIQRFIDFLKL